MQLEFYGATGTVTGSLHHIIHDGQSILLDCGLYQGKRDESLARNRMLPEFARAAQALVLSHAHIDHCGNIPTLVKRGFTGNIYATPATRDLVSVMLQDSAHIQEQDAFFLNKRRARDEKVEPLYTLKDALRSLENFISVPYHRGFPLGGDLEFTFYDAGHILGSAMVLLRAGRGPRETRLLFSGDLGRHDMPILRDPELPPGGADALILESTYGNRVHDRREEMDEHLAREIKRVAGQRGKVYIPSFSLERAQEVLLSIHRLEQQRRIPILPVYLDSPLAIAVTDVFRLHPECFDHELASLITERRELPFFTEQLVKVHDVKDSKELMSRDEAAIVIAGSGMCENGRIRHHLAWGLPDPKNTVLLVGFQAPNTLGRKLKDGLHPVRIFGEDIPVRAKILSLEGFSAHADRDDLVRFVRELEHMRPLKQIFLVHGEPEAQAALAEALAVVSGADIRIPAQGDVFDVT